MDCLFKMEKKNIILFVLVGLILSLGYIGAEYYVIMHEVTHQRIFSNYGMSSTISIGFLKGETTSPDANKCNDFCMMSNNFTEIIGYHTGILIFNAWILFFSYIIIKYLMEKL